LEQIKARLEERETIHEEVVNELESKKDWYVDRLEKLYKQSFSKEEEKRRLKGKIEEFYQEIRKEERRKWRDKIDLEREMLEVEEALREVEDWLWDLIR